MMESDGDDLPENIPKTDDDVEKMIEKWDIVKCRRCGEEISMLDAEIIEDKYFVCKKGC